MKFSPIRCLVALIYVCFMVKIMADKDISHIDNTITATILIYSLSIFLMIFNAEFVLPRQFTPLNELTLFGKTWRIICAVLAMFWGGLIGIGTIYQLIVGNPSAGQLLMGSIFVLVGYAGFKMIFNKNTTKESGIY